MSRVRSDPTGLLNLMGEAHDLDDLGPFTPEVLDRVADSLGSGFASYYELGLTTGEVLFYVRCRYEEAFTTQVIPSPIPSVHLERHVEAWNRSQGGIGAWSDVYSRAARRRLGSGEVPAAKTIDAAWLAFGTRGSRSCWLALHQSRDITQPQRDLFLSARTLVASLIRHADARRRLADVMIAIDADEEVGAGGVVLLGPSLEVERASPAARRIVARWFGQLGTELPDELAHWLRSQFPRQPLRVERGRDRLVVDAPTRGVLILREELVLSDLITAREHEVMSCVADGMSTEEIAQTLWVTPGTVSKHLEHIYRKLGVTSRTAALAALRRRRTS
jgi:DNA-binding CsgD family transcriptional regulator